MTKKIYTTAQGKSVDLGAIVLKNQHVRAVGNMNVNARGDLLDGSSRVIDTRNNQVTQQLAKTTQPSTVSNRPLHTSTVAARRNSDPGTPTVTPAVAQPVPVPDTTVAVDPVIAPPADTTPAESTQGGLAAAMARSRTVTQEKLVNPKEALKLKPGIQKL